MPSSALAKRQLALKMKLEPRLRREMAVLFAAISKDFKSLYAMRGTIIDADEYVDEVQQILRQHYRRVVKVFGTALRQQVSKSFLPEETKAVDEKVDEELRKFINLTTALQAKLIIETTKRDISGAVEFAIGLQETGQISNVAVAEAAQKQLNSLSKSRVDTIAVTETQIASEGAKMVEANAVASTASVIAGVPANELIKKEWVAILDSRTRDAHVAADGQRVGVNEPFTVGGELLNYPSDTSLGASLSNIINCRCISAVVVDNAPIVEAIDTRVKPQRGRVTAATVAGVIGL